VQIKVVCICIDDLQ